MASGWGCAGRGSSACRAGAIRWGDVGGGAALEQREVVQDALEDAGIAVTPLGESSTGSAARPVLRLRGTVRSAGFTLCARNGLDTKALSGEAKMEIEWRAESRAAGAIERRHVSSVTRHVDPKQAMPLGSIYRLLLRDSAADLARWLDEDPAS